MKKKILTLSSLLFIPAVLIGTTSCGKKSGADEYDEKGRLILNLKNLYFSDWTGGDPYTEILEDKFQVKVKAGSYSNNDWDQQVENAVNSSSANPLPDVFHFNLESFNFGNTYQFWTEGKILKQIPDDLSNWPNIKNMVESISHVDALKINGHLYGLPIAYNIKDPVKTFSSFTYVYHRDWAKECGVYKENDEYTWDEFLELLKAFKQKFEKEKKDAYALGDVEWGFPSITNFYKDAPHCYTYDENGKVINAFTSPKYCEGLIKAKDVVNKGYYFEQSEAHQGDVHNKYKYGQIGVYYENLSLTNYTNLRKEYANCFPLMSEDDLDEACAFMKVKGPDGKYALESTENWYSMSMFNYDISETKMNKILDIIDYLLGDEGTKLAVYGIEGFDYEIVDGEVRLLESGWTKDKDGNYTPKVNGAKNLRYMATLGNDTFDIDPTVNKRYYEIYSNWISEMKESEMAGNLRKFIEPAEIKWCSTPLKDANTSGLIEEGNENAMKFCYNLENYRTIDEYRARFSSKWDDTIASINQKLGKQ